MIREISRSLRNPSREIALTCALIVLGLLGSASAEPMQKAKQPADESPNAIPLEISANLGTLLTLEAKADRLQPVICTDFQDATPAFEAMGRRSGGGGSSSGGDGSRWQYSRDNEKWVIAGQYGVISHGLRRPQANPEFELDFIDKSDQGWRLMISASDDGKVSVVAFKKDSSDCFCLVQQADAKLFVAGVGKGQLVSGADANYRQLLNTQTQAANDLLLPELRKWGLTKLSGRFSSEVRDLLFQVFAVPEEQAKKDFDKAVADLSASVYETREQASAWLLENAKSNVGLIMKALLNSELPPEPRVRMRSVLEITLRKTEFETLGQIEVQKLADDPELLIWLLGETNDEITRSNIYQRLKQVTSQDLAHDVQPWKEWLISSGKQTLEGGIVRKTPAVPESYAPLQGPLLDLASIVALLLPLKVTDGKIQIDRKPWEERYDGKSVEQLGQELRQFAIDHGLPLDWLNVEVDGLKDIDYPHLIFQQFETKSKSSEEAELRELRRMSTGYVMRQMAPNRNPQVHNDEFTATLELDEGSNAINAMHSGRSRGGKKVFVLTLVDEKNPAHSLTYGSWPGGELRIVVTGPTSLVQIFQSADGKCSLDCAAENKSLHREFADADSLLADPHFQEKVADYLKQYGVQIAASANPSPERP